MFTPSQEWQRVARVLQLQQAILKELSSPECDEVSDEAGYRQEQLESCYAAVAALARRAATLRADTLEELRIKSYLLLEYLPPIGMDMTVNLTHSLVRDLLRIADTTAEAEPLVNDPIAQAGTPDARTR